MGLHVSLGEENVIVLNALFWSILILLLLIFSVWPHTMELKVIKDENIENHVVNVIGESKSNSEKFNKTFK